MTPQAIARLMGDPIFRYSNAMTLGYLSGLKGEDPDPELEKMSHRYEDGWLKGMAAREAGVKPKKFMGYHLDSELPIKRGDTVTIPKGTLVRCNGETKPAGRTYKIQVRSLGCGQNFYQDGNAFREDDVPMVSPTVVWAGTGGYWAEADINDIPEAQ